MPKNGGLYFSTLQIAVFAGLVGVITPAGCNVLNVLGEQTLSDSVRVDRNEIRSSPSNSPNTNDRFGIREGMPYAEAREILKQKGWQPNLLGDPPNLNDSSVKELFDLGYKTALLVKYTKTRK